MTREQVGQALEYSQPAKTIAKIHERNPDRLNPLSTIVSLTTVEGDRTVERDFFVYNIRGVMEICRFSRQPKADKFMDFVWDVMESLYNGNSVLAAPDQQTAVMPEAHRTASNTLGINFLILSQRLLAPKVHNQCRLRCVIIFAIFGRLRAEQSFWFQPSQTYKSAIFATPAITARPHIFCAARSNLLPPLHFARNIIPFKLCLRVVRERFVHNKACVPYKLSAGENTLFG